MIPKEMTTNPEQPLTFSSLPDEITENCLARISKWNYPSLSLVSRRFLSFISSPKLYTTRSDIGTTEPCLYFCLKFPKYPSPKWFTLLMKPPDDEDEDDDIQDEYSLAPVPYYSSHPRVRVPYSSSTVAVGSEIYLIGVPDDNSSPSKSVRILDCRNHTWRDGPNMKVERAGAFAVYLDQKIYVMGGREKDESWMEVFDVKTQTWRILASHGAELQSERWFKINVLEGKIYAIADKKDYAYDPEEGKWEAVEMHSSNGSIDAWCVIENVMYCYTKSGYCKWYDTKSSEWREVKGSDFEVLREDVICNIAWGYVLEIVNYGGKLLVFWVPRLEEDNAKRKRKIWCAKIALEKSHDGEIWGKMEWTNTVLTIPKSFKFLSCVVISI